MASKMPSRVSAAASVKRWTVPTGHQRPPARVSYGKQSTGLFSYFPALADAIRPWGRCPPSRLPARVMQPSGLRPSPTDAAAETKRWTVPTGHQRPPPPLKRWTKLLPAYGAHVRWPLAQTRRSAAVPWRELSRAATRRDLPGVQPPRIESPGTGQTLRWFSFFLFGKLTGTAHRLPPLFVCRKPLARRVVPKKACADDEDRKTPFVVK